MKKSISIVTVFLSILLLTSCIMIVPSNDTIGEPQKFSKAGITLLLTDRFREQESELGFDAYYSSDFCGVTVTREEFTLEEGLADRPLSEYIQNVIEANGHQDIQPQNSDDLWYYIKNNTNTRVYAFCYKGPDAFYIVQYICPNELVSVMEDTIFLWAAAVEFQSPPSEQSA